MRVEESDRSAGFKHTQAMYTGYNNQYVWAYVYVYKIIWYIYICLYQRSEPKRSLYPHRLLPHPTTFVSPSTYPTLPYYHFSLLNRRYCERPDRAAPRTQFFLRLIRLNYVSYVVFYERAETGAITTMNGAGKSSHTMRKCECFKNIVERLCWSLFFLLHTHFRVHNTYIMLYVRGIITIIIIYGLHWTTTFCFQLVCAAVDYCYRLTRTTCWKSKIKCRMTAAGSSITPGLL